MSQFSVAGSRVVVIGAARSGLAAAELLTRRGARVTVSEMQKEVGQIKALRAADIAVELGGHRIETLRAADLIVLSPGVSPRQPSVAEAMQHGVPIISEVELAARWLHGRIIAVTGTKGKSTTTVLTGRMFDASGQRAVVGGNIGTALSSQVDESTSDVIHVVEVSSFQLELTKTFRPWIAVCLNLSPDHFDRHESFQEYADAKARIFSNQTEEDAMVINADDSRVLEIARTGRARPCHFAVDTPLSEGVTVSDDAITLRSAGRDERLIPLSAVQVPGRHLLSDITAAAAVGWLAGIDSEVMTRAVESFTGLEHTLEFVGEVGGVRYVNDSKATNVVATRAAIECFGDGLVVILGGRFKAGRFEDLRLSLTTRGASVVALGEARPEIRRALASEIDVHDAETMDDAVAVAAKLGSPGGTVLLAPACASLDMFLDYAARGAAFKRAVSALSDRVGPDDRE